MIPLHK